MPHAQQALGADCRLLLPGYPDVLHHLAQDGALKPASPAFGPLFGAGRIQLLTGRMPGNGMSVIAIDAPWLYRRHGNPYLAPSGLGWPDNAARFALLGWIGAHIGAGDLIAGWEPDIVHAHDWHAGLTSLYLRRHPATAARTVFTVHNMAFQGRFPLDDGSALDLREGDLTPQGIEFHGELSFIKAGLVMSDWISTVSPTYAREITGIAHGHGLDGVIRSRSDRLSGILNGIDDALWDPSADRALPVRYSLADIEAKAINRRSLLSELGLHPDPQPQQPVLAVVSRLTEQKGLDLLLSSAHALLARGIRLVVLGSGDAAMEQGFTRLALEHRGRASVTIGFDEALSHRIFGGADAIVVPSRFEPCGLTQMYGLRYGTVPIVRRVGGLADTIVDEREGSAVRPANGFVFDDASPKAIIDAIERAQAAFADGTRWRRLIEAGMQVDLSWRHAAAEYLALYQRLNPRH